MLAFIKKHIGAIYIAAMTVAVIVFLICNHETADILSALKHMDGRCTLLALLCMVAFFAVRAGMLRYYLRKRGFHVSFLQALSVTGAGQFYSAITPSSSGGQPAQVLRLHRYGVSVPVATAAISVEFLGFQFGYLLLGALAWFSDRAFLSGQIEGFGWLVFLGFAFNSGVIFLILFAAISRRTLKTCFGACIRFAAKLHLVRDPQEKMRTFFEQIEVYRSAMVELLQKPLQTLILLLGALAQVLLFMGVTVWIYYAFGLTGTSSMRVLSVQLLLFTAAAFIPLPGAAGAQESGFCLFYRGIFPEEALFPAMVCWRFFTFYCALFAGFALTLYKRPKTQA